MIVTDASDYDCDMMLKMTCSGLNKLICVKDKSLTRRLKLNLLGGRPAPRPKLPLTVTTDDFRLRPEVAIGNLVYKRTIICA